MGEKKQMKQAIECPRGITIRGEKGDQRIQIAFSYEGTECRELMPPGSISKAAIAHTVGLRHEIQRKITDKTFVYADYFPDSPKVKKFGPVGGRVLIGTLLAEQLGIYEKMAADKSLSPSTLNGYRKSINGERMKRWSDVSLSECTQPELYNWIRDLGVTAKFARNLLTPLRSVLEDALNAGLIKSNPFNEIELSKLLKKTAKNSDYVVEPFSSDERAAIIDAARADERPMIQFWFNAGLRPGEMIALRWGKIDFKSATALIDLNVVMRTEKGPKTSAGIRRVDLNEDAISALSAQKLISMSRGEHVWLNPSTNTPWETDAQIRKTLWIPLLKRSGVKYRNPYQARHSFASAALTAGGCNPWYLAQQLGHADVEMVFRVYGKFIHKDYQKPQTEKPKADLRLFV